MPDNEKQEKILEDLKRHVKEMRFGSITIEFKVQDEVIVAGDIVEQKKRLG